MRGIALEFLAQDGILRRYADRAGIQMTDPHHDAAQRDQCRGRKPELFGSQKRGDYNVTPSF